MYAETVDFGPYIGRWQAFGPPDVVALDDFAGNASEAEHVSGFFERVLAVSFRYAADASVVNRFPRVRFFAGESIPFADVVAPFAVQATLAARFTFAVNAQGAGATNGPSIVTVLPDFLLCPGWSVVLDTPAGVAGDALSGVRVYRQRYRLLKV